MQDLHSGGEQTGSGTNENSLNVGSKHWVVMKFGGTSVSSVDHWKVIESQVQGHLQNNNHVLVVVSALSGVTNLLTRLMSEPAPSDVPNIIQSIETIHLELLNELKLSMDGELAEHWDGLLSLSGQPKKLLSPVHQARLLAHGELLSSTIGSTARQ